VMTSRAEDASFETRVAFRIVCELRGRAKGRKGERARGGRKREETEQFPVEMNGYLSALAEVAEGALWDRGDGQPMDASQRPLVSKLRERCKDVLQVRRKKEEGRRKKKRLSSLCFASIYLSLSPSPPQPRDRPSVRLSVCLYVCLSPSPSLSLSAP
jgi:hypothetical protein